MGFFGVGGWDSNELSAVILGRKAGMIRWSESFDPAIFRYAQRAGQADNIESLDKIF
jgi:hypothetical protein